MAARRRKR